MANALHGEVEVSIDGKPYTLRFGINELCAVQSDLGLAGDDDKFMRICMSMGFVRSYSGMRIAFHRALEKHHGVTLDEAGELVTALGFVHATSAIVECMQWSGPPKGKSEPESGGEPRPSRGPKS